MIHPTDDDPRVEFAGRWLNEQSPGSEFDVLASAQIGDTRAVVVADRRLAVIFYAQREEGRWALGQTAQGVELQAGPFATSGSFGPDDPEDWHMYVFGRVADPTGQRYSSRANMSSHFRLMSKASSFRCGE